MKVIKVIFIVIICILLAVPILTADFSRTYSDLESRTLSHLPEVYNKNEEFNFDFFSQYNNYYADHIGFRDQMIGVYAEVMVNGFGLSSSPKIQFGKEGWMFFVNDENIKIGIGEYKLTEEQLHAIALNQQMISDYYKSIGKEFVLVFTPSKASVYTEYVFGNYQITETLIDQVTDYLLENTDVKVINVKDAEINAKDKGNLYLKTDTHWNQLGTYYAYLDIVEKLNDYGLDIGEAVIPDFETLKSDGEFSKMLGKNYLLDSEEAYNAVWNYNTKHYINDDNEAIKAITEFNSNVDYMSANKIEPMMFVNINAQTDKKVLMYVDSMWSPGRGLPKYLSENFSEIMYTRMRTIDYNVDEIYDADVIFYSITERYIPALAGQPSNVPALAEDKYENEIFACTFKEYPKFDTWTGRKGFSINNETAEGISIKSITTDEVCKLRGWAVDFAENTAATDVYVRVGGKTFKTVYGIASPGVVQTFGYEEMRYSVFEIRIPAEYFEVGEKIQFVMVNSNTGVTYTPAEYTLVA